MKEHDVSEFRVEENEEVSRLRIENQRNQVNIDFWPVL
jgi:hypothetical protein